MEKMQTGPSDHAVEKEKARGWLHVLGLIVPRLCGFGKSALLQYYYLLL